MAISETASWVQFVLALALACAACAIESDLSRPCSKVTESATATVDAADCKAVAVEDPGKGGGRSHELARSHVEQRCVLAVRYRTAAGKTVRANVTRQGPDAAFKPGDTIDVAFDPAAENRPFSGVMKYGSSAQLWACATLAIAAALLFMWMKSKMTAASLGSVSV
jgi:hypothetical protein